jgi:hypothetical protein
VETLGGGAAAVGGGGIPTSLEGGARQGGLGGRGAAEGGYCKKMWIIWGLAGWYV